MSGTRENFFVLLGLSPDERNDALISGRIADKQQEWVRQKSKPGAQQTDAQRRLDLLPDIKRVLIDDKAAREREAAEARSVLKERTKEKLKVLNERIALFERIGSYTGENVRQLIRELAPDVTENAIRAALAAAGVANADDRPAAKRKKTSGLDDIKARGIAADLAALGKADLYEFLEAPKLASSAVLMRKAEARNKDLMTKGNTHEVNTAKRLTGLALDVFKTDETHRQYDYTRSIQTLSDFGPAIRAANRNGTISFLACEELVRQAVSRKVSEELAREFILDFAEKAAIHVQTEPSGKPPPPLAVCGHCYTVVPANEPKRERCGSCGKPLRTACPKCKSSVASSDAACGHCGFLIGNLALVEAAARAIGKTLAGGNLDDASRALREAMDAFGDWPEWQRLAGEIDACRRQVEKTRQRNRQAQADLEAKLTALGREKKWESARKLLPPGAESRGESAGLVVLDDRIAQALKVAASLFEAAQAAERKRDTEEAAHFIEKTLEACADFQLARQAVGRLPPPPPPSALKVEVGDRIVRLSWRGASGKRRIDYRIVRGRKPAPTLIEGERIGSAATAAWDDGAATAGTWYYAVYTHWLGSFSATAAVAGPISFLEPVQGLVAEAWSSKVTLRWTRPNGCTHVRIALVSRPREKPREVSGDTFADEELKNGDTYRYTVTALYSDPSQPGVPIAGPAQSIAATPIKPPSPLREFTVHCADGVSTLQWTPAPPDYKIEFLKVPSGLEPKLGTVMSRAEAARRGKIIPADAAGRIELPFRQEELSSIVALSVKSEVATVGASRPLDTSNGVRNLRAEARPGDRVALLWDWPAALTAAKISVAVEYDPGMQEERNVDYVTKADYDRAGYFDLPAEGHRMRIAVVGRTADGADAPPATLVHVIQGPLRDDRSKKEGPKPSSPSSDPIVQAAGKKWVDMGKTWVRQNIVGAGKFYRKFLRIRRTSPISSRKTIIFGQRKK